MTDLSVPPPGCFPIRPLFSGRDNNSALTPIGTATQKMADLELHSPLPRDDDDTDDDKNPLTDPATPLSDLCRIVDSARYSALSPYLHRLTLADFQVLEESDFMELGVLCKEHMILMKLFYHQFKNSVTRESDMKKSDRARIIYMQKQ
jgi:hypothetical protein